MTLVAGSQPASTAKIARILPRGAALAPALPAGPDSDRDVRDVVVHRERTERAARDKKAKSAHGLSLFVVAKWLVAERRPATPAAPRPPGPSVPAALPASPAPFSRMPENFLRSLRRRSLRSKKAKTVLQEKRKSDSFVNSQEWTLSRGVPDLRLGIVGSLSSGKSALVHRYLTGSYMQEESPEGGRFKKEMSVDGTSYLLLIRDEGGAPEMQFAAWVDAVIFVFSLENEASFNAIYSFYTKMAHFRNSAEIPLILVGTQDAISESNPRVIDDSRARKLAADLKRCSYYETCATYGLNVERVFQDACQKIVHQRLSASSSCLTPSNSRPSTPLGNFSSPQSASQSQPLNTRIIHQNMPVTPTITSTGVSSNGHNTSGSSGGSPAAHGHHTLSHKEVMNLSQSVPSSRQVHTLSSGMRHHDSNKLDSLRPAEAEKALGSASGPQGTVAVENNNMVLAKCLAAPPPNTTHGGTGFDGSVKIAPPQGFENIGSRFASSQGFESLSMPPQGKDGKDLPTPSSTPTTSRKSRRRSNLFTPSKKGEDKLRNGELGSGRAIPLKQGYLYKRSSKALNKEWKKKYVTLCDDGKLTYHPSLHDYMDDVHGKEISLQYVTVKVPGQKPRGSKTINSSNMSVSSNGVSDGLNSLTITSFQGKDKRPSDKVQLTGFEMLKDSNNRLLQPASTDDSLNFSINGHSLNGSDGKLSETPNVKKRHRRMKSSSLKNTDCDDSDGYEFFIVSLDNKQWHFEAGNSEERDEWVAAIEQQILNSLQGNEISKSRSRLQGAVDTASIQVIRTRVQGNTNCIDCEALSPDWASLNLGVLMCIECSGIHRNLGSHISRVRSLDLDEWPQGHLSVMLALGNTLANGVWEARVPRTCVVAKPTPYSSREEKERWIRAKYEAKEFLAPPSFGIPLGQQLIDAVCRADMKCVYTLLAHCTAEHVNSTVSPRDLRTPLHLACALGNVAIAQLLIWHNANVKAVDQEGQTCLSLARAAARQPSPDPNVGHLIELLQANGAPELSVSTAPRRQPISSLPPNSLDTLPSSVI